MRIAIDYSAAVNQRAGVGRLVRNQVLALADVDQVNQYQLVYARPNRGTPPAYFPKARNFNRHEVGLRERWLTIMWHRARLPLPADWLSGPVDLYHSPDFVLPPLRRARGVLTVHDLAFLMRPECADARLRAYLEEVVPRSVQRAEYIIADSENTRNDLVVLLGVNPDAVSVVPGGVEERFAPVTDGKALDAIHKRIGVGDAPFILSIGVIEPRKNLNRLMDAFRLLKEREIGPPDLKLVLAGGHGWLVEGILQHHAKSPVRSDILMPGFIADDLLPALYSAASVFAFPSLYEGFGLPILEAMACGTPVVASKSSCLPEVAEGASALIDPDDTEDLAGALEQTLCNPELRTQLSEKGRARAAEYTWGRAARSLLNVYQKVAR
ncbi:MAG TPA: glycosyltransferase family 1 protein [Chloroflexota bacterium]|nr:glycosyltransferase family 1 protein [Chloroflexota bacterium]